MRTPVLALPGAITRAFALALVLLAGLAAGQTAEAGVINASSWTKVAIEGADPVAYFTDGRHVEGSKQFTHTWQGATWRFASAANRDAFAANPDKYAPQYGGYCAFAVSRGYTASIDPEAWSIVDGKLYLNYSIGVRAQWNEDVPGNIKNGDANWPRLRADLAS